MVEFAQVKSVETPASGGKVSKTDEIISALRPRIGALPLWDGSEEVNGSNALFIPNPQNVSSAKRGVSRAVNSMNDALAAAGSDARFEVLSRLAELADGNKRWCAVVVRTAGKPEAKK